jgi:hypothetical protein
VNYSKFYRGFLSSDPYTGIKQMQPTSNYYTLDWTAGCSNDVPHMTRNGFTFTYVNKQVKT